MVTHEVENLELAYIYKDSVSMTISGPVSYHWTSGVIPSRHLSSAGNFDDLHFEQHVQQSVRLLFAVPTPCKLRDLHMRERSGSWDWRPLLCPR